MAGMRYPPPIPPGIPMSPEEFDLDENGNVNWRLAWHKEIGHLQTLTAEQEKAGVDSEWYRMMLFRIRSAVILPPMNPEMMHAMASHMPATAQPPTGELPQQQQPVQP